MHTEVIMNKSAKLMVTVLLTIVVLSACEARFNVSSKPTDTSGTPLSNVYDFPSQQPKGTITVKEICHEGVLYLLTDRGGLTAKINPRHESGTTMGWAHSPFISCKQ